MDKSQIFFCPAEIELKKGSRTQLVLFPNQRSRPTVSRAVSTALSLRKTLQQHRQCWRSLGDQMKQPEKRNQRQIRPDKRGRLIGS